MKRGEATSEHHRIAFEAYFETRNWTSAMKAAGCSYPTVFRWAADYRCEHNCPYHRWDALIQEREKIAKEQLALQDRGIHDPISHGRVISSATAERFNGTAFPITSTQRKKAALIGIAKSDVERLAQLELLYNKIFYDLTGIPLAYQTYLDSQGSTVGMDLEDIYGKGIHADSLKTAINALTAILAEIDKIKKRAGLIDETGRDTTSEKVEEEQKAAKQLSLHDLREIRDRLEVTPPEELAMMRAVLQSEQHTVQAFEHGQRAG